MYRKTLNSASVITILTLFVTPVCAQVEPSENLLLRPSDIVHFNSRESLVDYNGYFKPAQDNLWAGYSAATNSGHLGFDSLGQDFHSDHRQTVGASEILRLVVGVEALFWERGRAEDTVFATEDNGNQWSFSDFNLTETGVRYRVQYMTESGTGIELTYFDFDSFSSTLDADGQNVVPVFFDQVPATMSNSFDFVYESRLQSIELNSWVRKKENKRTAFGIRYLSLDEDFNVLATNGLFSNTDNDLWGITRSWERGRAISDRMSLVGGLNLGVYLNRAELEVDTLNIDDSSGEYNVAGNVGFNIGLRYQVNNHFEFRVGYEGLALFGVALASTQSLNQSVFTGLEDPELGSIYFGGVNVGAVARF